MDDFIMAVLTLTGGAFWACLILVLALVLVRAMWDGFRAFTIAVWSCQVCKKNRGSYFYKGMVRYFFANWLNLLFTRPRVTSIQGPGGYWHEWNDWRAYKKAKRVQPEEMREAQ